MVTPTGNLQYCYLALLQSRYLAAGIQWKTNSTNMASLSLNHAELTGSKKLKQVESQGKKIHIY